MPRQNVTTKRFGRDLGAGRLSTAQVSITHDKDTARVVLEVDATERTAAVLRMHPDDIATLGEALGAAAKAMESDSTTFPGKHSRK